MASDDIFRLNSMRRQPDVTVPSLISRIFSAIARQFARLWCGLHGHLILLHFEPNKLSLQCALCGYESEGWEVGGPIMTRRQVINPQARPERRRTLRPVPSSARLAS